MDPTGPGTSGPLPDLDDAGLDTIERLMSGSGGSVDWFEVVELLDRLRGEGAADNDDLRVRHHVAAAAAVARRVNASLVPTARRRDHHLRVGVAAAAATVVASVGLASADTLPRPLQNVVSHVVAIVGVDVPDGGTRPVPVPVPDPADPGLAPPEPPSPVSPGPPVTSAAPSTAPPTSGRAPGGAGGAPGVPEWFRFEPDVSREAGSGTGRADAPPWRSWAERRDDERSLRRSPSDDPRLNRRSAPTAPWPALPWTPPAVVPAPPAESAAPPAWPFLPRPPATANQPLRPSAGAFGADRGDDLDVNVAGLPDRTDRNDRTDRSGGDGRRPSGRPAGRPAVERTPPPGPANWLLGRLVRRPPTPPRAAPEGHRR
jgi:hypothetical protein